MQKKRWLIGVLLSSMSFLFFGCHSLILPTTAKTNDRDGEYIVINMLDRKDMLDNYKSEYEAVYKTVYDEDLPDTLMFSPYKKSSGTSPRKESASLSAMGADLLGRAIIFAAEGAKKALREEASLHVANYGKQIAKDNFWDDDFNNEKWEGEITPKYYGFEIIRMTNQCKDTELPAAKLVFGLYPANGNAAMFLVAPLYMEITSVKAKTSDWKWFSVIPPFWYQFFMANYSQTVNINADVVVTGVSVDEENNFKEQILLDKKVSLPPINIKTLNSSKGIIMSVAKDEGLKKNIEKLKRDIEGLKGDTNKHEGDTNKHEVSIEKLKGDIEKLKGDIEKLKGDIEKLKLKGNIKKLKKLEENIKKLNENIEKLISEEDINKFEKSIKEHKKDIEKHEEYIKELEEKEKEKELEEKEKELERNKGKLKNIEYYIHNYYIEKMPVQTSCWWLAPPISVRKLNNSNYYGQGTFYLKVIVTEEDASKCKTYIEKAADTIDKNQENIKTEIINIYNKTIKENKPERDPSTPISNSNKENKPERDPNTPTSNSN